jgi:hypothetical protein
VEVLGEPLRLLGLLTRGGDALAELSQSLHRSTTASHARA